MTRSRRATLLSVLAFVAMTAIVTFRTWHNVNVPGRPDLPLYGLHDFRDVLYYPARAMLDGRNPFAAETYVPAYPVARPLAPYAPTTLLLHTPFALMPYPTARWVHYGINVLLILVLAWMCLRECGVRVTAALTFGLGALLLATRPAHMTLYIGQCALYMVIGAYVALQYGRRRPWLAGLGLALACVKPTYGAPLAMVMLVRRDFRAVAWGLAVTAALLAAIGGILVVEGGGLTPLLVSFRDSYTRLLQDVSANPTSSVIRLDVVAFLSRLLGHELPRAVEAAISGVVLGVGLCAVWVIDGTPVDEGRLLSTMIACLTILTFTYHQAYDGLLLALPAVALATADDRMGMGRAVPFWIRCALLALMLVPALNYGATDTVLALVGLQREHMLWRLLTSANSIALTAALALAVVATFRAAVPTRRLARA
jgi:hypothetical protein